MHNSEPTESWYYRPEQRVEFCQSVATRAKEIASRLIQKQKWRQVFNKETDSAIRHQLINENEHHLDDLHKAAEKLTDNLGKLKRENKHDPSLVVVFDEASSLLRQKGSKEIKTGRYVALNRIMSCLKEYRIWLFIVSTESQVGTLVPPNDIERTDYVDDPSARLTV